MSSRSRTRYVRPGSAIRYASRIDQDLYATAPMRPPGREDQRLAQVTRICLAHAGASRYLAGCGARFEVRTEPFGYYLDDHRGQGIVAVCFRQPPGEVRVLRRGDSVRYDVPPAFVGRKGWVAVRLDMGEVDWDELRRLAGQSYQRTVAGEW
jgi:hypothetical protein